MLRLKYIVPLAALAFSISTANASSSSDRDDTIFLTKTYADFVVHLRYVDEYRASYNLAKEQQDENEMSNIDIEKLGSRYICLNDVESYNRRAFAIFSDEFFQRTGLPPSLDRNRCL